MSDLKPDKDELHSEPVSRHDDRPKANFSDLVGRWTPDLAFDEVIASQRKIEPAKWS